MSRRRATFKDTKIGASLNLVLIAQRDPGPVQVFTLPLLPLTWLVMALWLAGGKLALLGRVVLWCILSCIEGPGVVAERAIEWSRVALLVGRVWGAAWLYGCTGVNL